MELTYQQEILAPIDVVFSFLIDDEKMKLWMEGLEAIEYPKGKDLENPAGTEFVHSFKEGGHSQKYAGSITEYKAPTLIVVELHNPAFQNKITYELTAMNRKTQMDYHCEIEYASLISRIMGFLFSGSTNRILKTQMKSLKLLSEQEAVRRPALDA